MSDARDFLRVLVQMRCWTCRHPIPVQATVWIVPDGVLRRVYGECARGKERVDGE